MNEIQHPNKKYKISPGDIINLESGKKLIIYSQGGFEESYWNNENILHRLDGPSIIKYNINIETGELIKVSEVWFKNGKVHRERDEPAEEHFWNDGKKKIKKWFMDGMIQREGGNPAEEYYYSDGVTKDCEKWYSNGFLEKETYYYSNGYIECQRYYSNGCLHSEDDEPAETKFSFCEFKNYDGKIISSQGDVISEKWYHNGLLHREGDKPAEIYYEARLSNKSAERWYHNGKIFREGNKPQEIIYFANERGIKHRWYNQEGKLEKEELIPYEVEYYENGNKKFECYVYLSDKKDFDRDDRERCLDIIYYENGQRSKEVHFLESGPPYRQGGPALVKYYQNGNVKKEEWWRDKTRDIKIFPCKITYYENGNKEFEKWGENDNEMPENHRDGDKPAIIFYHQNGNIKTEEWWFKNDRHREGDLPAIISYNEEGNKIQEEWYYEHLYFRFGYDKNFRPKPSLIKYNNLGEIQEKENRFGYFYNDDDFRLLSDNSYNKVLYFLRKRIKGYKKRKREEFFQKLKSLKIFTILCDDILEEFCRFIY